jgi:magnesium transporter
MQWHDIRNPKDPELDRLAERYHLHPLHIEDCRDPNQSAKVEEGPGYLFIVLKLIRMVAEDSLELADLDIFVGRDFVISVEEAEWPDVLKRRGQIRASAADLRSDQLLYRIADGIVDSYTPVLDRVDDIIDGLEDDCLATPSPETLSRIFRTKRNLILLRRVLVNTRDVAAHLQRTESDLIAPEMLLFLRDLYDHVARNLDTVEMQRDLLAGALDVYLSSVANRTNQVMKVLTVLGTIALPVLVISGVYGMNIKPLPWADSPHAGLIITGVTALFTAILLFFLRIFHWL